MILWADVDSALRSLHGAYVDSVADFPDVDATYNFRIQFPSRRDSISGMNKHDESLVFVIL